MGSRASAIGRSPSAPARAFGRSPSAPARAATALVLVLALAACGGARLKANTELSDDDLALTSSGSSTPATTASASAAPPPAEPPPPASPPAPTADVPLACPVQCVIATPRHRTLAPDEQERLRAAVTPTLSALRSCASSANGEGRHRPPGVILRFATTGEVLDFGIDDTGWGESNADACFQSLHSGPNPDVRVEGPATVRCAERCERPNVTTQKATRKKK
jgi:hypothetical protein